MNVNAQSEEMARQMHAARLARVNMQRMRLLAAQRAQELERKLKDAAESGLRAEITRAVVARSSLQTVARRKRVARYAAVAAFGAVICAASLGMGWAPVQQAPVLAEVPGDRLKLALSYSVSLPGTR
jgi:hypothetical protein